MLVARRSAVTVITSGAVALSATVCACAGTPASAKSTPVEARRFIRKRRERLGMRSPLQCHQLKIDARNSAFLCRSAQQFVQSVIEESVARKQLFENCDSRPCAKWICAHGSAAKLVKCNRGAHRGD